MAQATKTSDSNLDNSVEYIRRVFDHNLFWYKNADAKAEIILTLDGVFLGFVTSLIFINQIDLIEILRRFTSLSWLCLGLMVVCLTGSIVSSIICLWSRIPMFVRRAQKNYFVKNGIDVNNMKTYLPETTFFFQKISWLEPTIYQKYMLSTGKKFEISALALDVHVLSKNVLKKHKWVDIGFFLTGLSLLCFLAFSISYLLTLV
jgi:hypothetical protein